MSAQTILSATCLLADSAKPRGGPRAAASRRTGFPGWRAAAATLALLLACTFGPGDAGAEADPPLLAQSGDVLAVSVLEDTTLDREARVDASGRIMLPRLGSIAVAGLDLDQVREAVEGALKAQDIILEPTVIVEFAAYRRIYVDGVVAAPGAVAYEPGLTVRKAVALAGGLARSEETNGVPPEELMKLNAQWRASSFAMLEVQSRIGRLKAELDGRRDVPAETAADPAVPPASADEIQSLDRGLLAGSLDLHDKEQVHMKDLLGLTDFLLGVLQEQARYLERERTLQQKEVSSARALAEKGAMPLTRLSALEREEARLGRDILELKAYIARSQQDKETLAYELAATDRKRKVKLESDLRDAVIERTKLEQEAELLTSQILAKGISLTDANRLEEVEPVLRIHRDTEGREETVVAEMSTPLRPGDVLEVSYRTLEDTKTAELGQ